MARRRRLALIALVPVVALAGVLLYRRGRSVWHPVYRRIAGQRTVAQIVEEYGPAAEGRLRPAFEAAGVAYPPKRLALLAFKKEKRLELWADSKDKWTFIHPYRILAASGHAGPKLREGDRQVPEGLYQIVGLNPNSSYHLSMKLNYPNAFDLRKAAEEGRSEPGCDIFIHGKAVSIGCLALGDPAIEELFVLVARTGKANATVIIASNDLRKAKPVTDPKTAPSWLPELYGQIREALKSFPLKDATPNS